MFLKSSYREEITYWAPTGRDDGFGKKVLASPVSFKARWVDEQEQILDSKGMQTISKAKVFVDDAQSVEIDGFLYPGVSFAADPRGVDGAFQVMMVNRVPDLRNLQAVKVAIL